MLRKIENNTYQLKRYIKSGKKYYRLHDGKGKIVYQAYRTDGDAEVAEYVFENRKRHKKYIHSVSAVTSDASAVKSFTFDGTDIWHYLKTHGITFRITVVNNDFTVYRVFFQDRELASANCKKQGDDYTFGIASEGDNVNLDVIFLVFFALLRTQ